MINAEDFPSKVRYYIELLEAMPGIGFLTAVTLIAEIGDFSKFNSHKAFTAFFGIAPVSISRVNLMTIETRFPSEGHSWAVVFSLQLRWHQSGQPGRVMLLILY